MDRLQLYSCVNGNGSMEGSCIAKPSLENVLSQTIQSLQHLLGVPLPLLLMPLNILLSAFIKNLNNYPHTVNSELSKVLIKERR